jgi:STE24 endopeptidase
MLVMSATVWVTVSNPELCTKFGFEGINYGFAYILVGIFLGLLQPLMSLVTNARSRRAEYRADRQAVKEGYGEAMISAFKKLAKDNFSHLSPSKINVVLEYSHPPLDRRVDAVREALKEQDR